MLYIIFAVCIFVVTRCAKKFFSHLTAVNDMRSLVQHPQIIISINDMEVISAMVQRTTSALNFLRLVCLPLTFISLASLAFSISYLPGIVPQGVIIFSAFSTAAVLLITTLYDFVPLWYVAALQIINHAIEETQHTV